MKARYHFSLAGASAGVAAWNELCHAEISGTGQTAADLLRLRYSALWVAQVLPWSVLSVALFAASALLCGFGFLTLGQKEEAR